MMSGIGASNSYFSQMRMQGMKGSGGGERFNKLDTDGNGGIDQAELQGMADKISEKTGKEINVTELSETYDADGNGLLGQDEMQTMMMQLHGKGGGQRGGGASLSQSLAAYQSVDPQDDFTSTVLDMFGAEEDDEKDSSPINTIA